MREMMLSATQRERAGRETGSAGSWGTIREGLTGRGHLSTA